MLSAGAAAGCMDWEAVARTVASGADGAVRAAGSVLGLETRKSRAACRWMIDGDLTKEAHIFHFCQII